MLDREIDKPLGQGKPAASASRGGVSRKAVLTGVIGLALVGGSAAMALRDRNFRTPPIEVAVAEPPKAAPEEPKAAEPKPPQNTDESASVAMAAPPEEEGGESSSIIKFGPSNETTAGTVKVSDPTDVRQNARFAHVPEKDLIERTESGPLPKMAADGRRPFDVYAGRWSGARGARVAIVIGGLGMSQTGTEIAIEKLPPSITLAFAPEGNSLGRWMTAARRDGHEVLMQLPLEPFDYPRVNPGRGTLTLAKSPDENVRDMRWTLARTTNYVGVMNYMGAKYTANPTAMELVMSELGKRGLAYLDDGTSARSQAPDLAAKNGVPFAGADTVIDDEQERGAIMSKLDDLERTARAKGFAIGTGSAFDVTVDAVQAWAEDARKRGIEVVPVSALAADPRKG